MVSKRVAKGRDRTDQEQSAAGGGGARDEADELVQHVPQKAAEDRNEFLLRVMYLQD